MHTESTIKALICNVWIQSLFWILIGYVAVSGILVENYMGNSSKHFVIEVAAGFIAIMVAIIAFTASLYKDDVLMRFVGMAHLSAGLTDLLHAFFAKDILLLPISVAERFIPGSWTAGRTAFALILLFGIVRVLKEGGRPISIIPAIIIAIAISTFTMVLFAMVSLPAFIVPDAQYFNRPWEILAIVLLVVVMVIIFVRMKKNTDIAAADDISRFLIPGILLHLVVQTMMTGSPVLFNAYFDAAHVLKAVAYTAIIVPVGYFMMRGAKYSIEIKSLIVPSVLSVVVMAMVMVTVVGNISEEEHHTERFQDQKRLSIIHTLQRHISSMTHNFINLSYTQSDISIDAFWNDYDAVYDLFSVLSVENERYNIDYKIDMDTFAVYAYDISKNKKLTKDEIREYNNLIDILIGKLNTQIANAAEQKLLDLERSDEAENKNIHELILRQAYFLLIALPIIIALSMWQIRRQTRPITRLNEMALRVSRGEYGLIIDSEEKDEIGVLSNSFNRMLKSLNDTMGGLEQSVMKRTTELETSRQHLQNVLDNVDDGIITTDMEGIIESTNSAIKNIFGYENSELIGQDIKIITPELIHKSHDNNIEKYQKHGIAIAVNAGYRTQTAVRKGGENFPIEISVTEVVEHERRTLVAIIRDISDRKKAEKSLMESKERMSRFFDASMEGLFFQKDGKILDVNEVALTMTGYDSSEVIGHSLFEFIVPESQDATSDYMKSDLRDKWYVDVICKNGIRIPVEIQTSTIKLDGETVGIAAIRDISDRLKTEKESLQLAAELTHFIDTANAPIFGVDKKGMINEWNNKTEELTGYPKDEVMGCMLLYEFIAEEHRDSVKKVFSDALEGKVIDSYELRLITKTGKDLLLLFNAKARKDYNGGITGVIGVGQDITELDVYRRKMEQKVHDRTQELNAIFTLSPDGFVLVGSESSIVYVNPAFLEMTGYERHELMGITADSFAEKMNQLLDKDQTENLSSIMESEHCEKLVLSKPSKKVIQCDLKIIKGNDEKETGRVLYFRDITHEFEVDQMKSDFLATAAHELRTPLASILGFSELLLTHDYAEDRRKDVTETIHRQSVKLKQLLDELLDLSRIEARAGKDFNIENKTMQHVVLMACEEIEGFDKNRKLIVNNITEWPVVEIDEEKTHRVLMNVLSNAYKYSEKNTTVSCSMITRYTKDYEEFGVSIEDHGIGMTKQQLARVGERFYRADNSGTTSGTGLGMSLVNEIMKLQNGEVEINSRRGKGTTVTLWFPIVKLATQES